MASAARILTISIPAIDTTTAFQIQFAPGGTSTWTAFSQGDPDIPVAELVSGDYTLDGVNGAANAPVASQEGNWYQTRLKSGSLYGMWSQPFRVGAPTAEDILLRLTGMGITPTGVDLNAAAADGLAYFETACGRRFLALEETRTFDLPTAPSGVVDLMDDCYGNPSAVSVGGTAKTLNTDYRMRDQNAFARGKPFWGLQFPSPSFMVSAGPFPFWNSLSVTALWGYGTTIPNDLFDGMVLAGLMRLLPDLGIAVTGALVKWTEAEVTEDYGGEAYGKWQERSQMQLDKLATKYRRVQVGVGG